MDGSHIFLLTIAVVGAIGLIGGLVLYITAKKFKVDEDPRIDSIEALLPGANCGGCGCRGCRDFATQCVKRGSLEGLNCPGARDGAMAEIAAILGVGANTAAKRIAVLRCNGTCEARPKIYRYDGVQSCAIIDAVGIGTSGCSYGCLGCGDCVKVCRFGALTIDAATGLATIDADACTGCGVCVAECPRNLIELRNRGPRERRVWVACANRDKGAVARKVCASACIGCGKCKHTCPFDAISVVDNLAYINPDKCKACGKCITVCPTGAIHSTFQPIVKEKTQE